MNIIKSFLLVLFLFSISLFVPKTAQAFDLRETLTSTDSIVVKIQEGIEYFFAFKVENKIQVLEKHAEKRLTMAQNYAEDGEGERIQNLMQNYLQIKAKQNDLLGKTSSEDVLVTVEERTIEQQKTMESIKTKVEGDQKQLVVQTQEQVVNQIAERIVEVNGAERQAEFFQKVEHVWAPGTGPGGESGVVIEGGTMQFAPGTSAGGPSGQDIKTVEIKTGGTVNDPVPVQDGPNYAPGTTSGGNTGNTVESGSQDMAPGTTSEGETWIDP